MWEWKCINYSQPCELAVQGKMFLFPESRDQAQCPACRMALVKTAQRIRSRSRLSRILRPLLALAILAAGGAGAWYLVHSRAPLAAPVAAPGAWTLQSPGPIQMRQGENVSRVILAEPPTSLTFASDKPLPEGLVLEKDGRVHGAPLKTGDATIVVIAQDSQKQEERVSLEFAVRAATVIVGRNQSVHGMVGRDVGPLSISAIGEAKEFQSRGLPAELKLDGLGVVTGKFSALPPAHGQFDVRAKNSDGEWGPWEQVEVNIVASDEVIAVAKNQHFIASVGKEFDFPIETVGTPKTILLKSAPPWILVENGHLKGTAPATTRATVQVSANGATVASPWIDIEVTVRPDPADIAELGKVFTNYLVAVHSIRNNKLLIRTLNEHLAADQKQIQDLIRRGDQRAASLLQEVINQQIMPGLAKSKDIVAKGLGVLMTLHDQIAMYPAEIVAIGLNSVNADNMAFTLGDLALVRANWMKLTTQNDCDRIFIESPAAGK